MRFLYVKLTGYVGLYNGLGLPEIKIDFSKAKNKICVISGPNGVGKSTLNNALNILPDGNDNFVSSMAASKYIKLTDGDNIYEITINHPIDKHNNRSVSKASILKNGIELNPNGNISSYKEIIYSEFDLDSNYVALSKISGDNRGLADKKPGERKKIMSSIISSLEVYNNLFKNLNKKANIFKSYINNLSTKIQNIGDEAYLRSTMVSLDEKIKRLENIIEQSKNEVIELNTILKMNDPDGSIMQRYDNLIKMIEQLENDKKNVYNSLCRQIQSNKYDDMDINTIDNSIISTENALKSAQNEIDKLNYQKNSLLSSISEYSNEIDRLNIKISKLEVNLDNELEQKIDQVKQNISNIGRVISELGIVNIDDITESEINYLISFLNKFIQSIDELYSMMSSEMFSMLYLYKTTNTDILSEIENTNNRLNTLKNYEKELNRDLIQITTDISLCLDLDKRPKQCKNDKCSFIENALLIVSKYGSREKMESQREVTESELNRIRIEIKGCEVELEIKREMILICSKFDDIYKSIETNLQLLSKFSITSDIVDLNKFLELVQTEYRFNSLRNINQYLDIANHITEYKSSLKVLVNLETEYKIQSNNHSIKLEYEKELAEKSSTLQELKESYNTILRKNSFNSDLVSNLSDKLQKLVMMKEIYLDWKRKEDEYESLKKEADEINRKFESNISILNKLGELNKMIENCSIEINPFKNQRKTIESQLTMLESFQQEYEMYKEKYTFIDVLRKYSSPTQDSIQALFMSIYMDKTLDMVNQLLSMIFNGEYRILPYVINADEFRIPFVGNGMPVDDISSGSTSQVCIMGMIINLVLYNMGSSKFGIVTLDEIDGGLDHNNRYLFVDVLQKISDILNIDQLIIISHSVESALNAVDVILLSDSDEYKDLFANANIIYQFNRAV